MPSCSSNPSGGGSDGGEDQENQESAEQETIDYLMLLKEDDKHLPFIKRKRRKIRKDRDPKEFRLEKEKLLKRPISYPDAAAAADDVPPLDSEPPPPAAVFDSDTDTADGHDEQAPILAILPGLDEFQRRLLEDLPVPYKKLMDFMGARASSSASPNLVLEKRLTKGDVDERRNRLLISQVKMRKNFLEMEEEEKLNAERWWTVEIIEPDCSVSLITLSKWETWRGPAYVLITEWFGLVERNQLKEGDLMQLWSFRAGGGRGHGRLCFMLLEIGDGDGDEEEDDDQLSTLESSG